MQNTYTMTGSHWIRKEMLLTGDNEAWEKECIDYAKDNRIKKWHNLERPGLFNNADNCHILK